MGAFMVSVCRQNLWHPQCPNVGDSKITHIWTLGCPLGWKNRMYCATLHDENRDRCV